MPRLPRAAFYVFPEKFPNHLGGGDVLLGTEPFEDCFLPGIYQDGQPGGAQFQWHLDASHLHQC